MRMRRSLGNWLAVCVCISLASGLGAGCQKQTEPDSRPTATASASDREPRIQLDVALPRVPGADGGADGAHRSPTALLVVKRSEIRLADSWSPERSKERSDARLGRRVVELEDGRLEPADLRGGPGVEVIPALLDGLNKVGADRRAAEDETGVRLAVAAAADMPMDTMLQVHYTALQAGMNHMDFWLRGSEGRLASVGYVAPNIQLAELDRQPLGVPPPERSSCLRPSVIVTQRGVYVVAKAGEFAFEVDGRKMSSPRRVKEVESKTIIGRIGGKKPGSDSRSSEGNAGAIAELAGGEGAEDGWAGQVLGVAEDGTTKACPTVDGAQTAAQMEKLAAALDGFQAAPSCGWADVYFTGGTVRFGDWLRVFATLESHPDYQALAAGPFEGTLPSCK